MMCLILMLQGLPYQNTLKNDLWDVIKKSRTTAYVIDKIAQQKGAF